MRNLQELFDAYLRTEPTAEKIKSATSMLIHVGKAFNVPTQEEINREYYPNITRILDEFFAKSPAKARLDKAILAEMIGRVGIKPSLKPILEDLLNDADENVRQFTIQGLEYHGCINPKSVWPVIEKYRKAEDTLMVAATANLAAKLACSKFSQVVLDRLARWYRAGAHDFVADVLKRLIHLLDQGTCEDKNINAVKLKEWARKNCPAVVKVFSHR
jgi:hypothetical protein